jgi:hypothetical protein
MNDNETEFQDFVRQIKLDDRPDYNHRDALEQRLLVALANQPWQEEQPVKIWRTIMKSQITKLATAAVIILAVALSVSIFSNSTSPAWAVEATAEALDQFNAVYIYGVAAPSLKALEQGFDKEIVGALLKDRKIPVEVEFWAQANQERTRSGNIRMETSDGLVGTADDTKTCIYEPNSNTIYVQKGCHIMIEPWLSGDFLLKVKEFAEDWQVTYGKDSATGKDLAFISCVVPSLSHSMWIEIDLETNLPVRYKIWHNTKRKGVPAYDIRRIMFLEQLPDERFQLQIPEGAKVVEYGFE